MTATIDYAPPVTTTSVPAPPTVQCPACLVVVPHAIKCRRCDRDMPDMPFCFHCRTWTAPIDKTTCVKVQGDDALGGARYAMRGCPNCRSMPPDSFLANIGMLMAAWANEVSKLRPSAPRQAPTEATVQPSADLPVRITRTQAGFVQNTTVEYDLPGMGQGNVPTLLVNRVRGDTPLGTFLKDIAERYAAMQEQLNATIAERDAACAERDDLKALLE